MEDIIRWLSPLPKIQNKRPRSRKAESATILTSSFSKPILLKCAQDRHAKRRNNKVRQPKASQSKRSAMNLKKKNLIKKRIGHASFVAKPIATPDSEKLGPSTRSVSTGPMRNAPKAQLNSSVKIGIQMTTNNFCISIWFFIWIFNTCFMFSPKWG